MATVKMGVIYLISCVGYNWCHAHTKCASGHRPTLELTQQLVSDGWKWQLVLLALLQRGIPPCSRPSLDNIECLLDCTQLRYRGFQVGWGNGCRVANHSCVPNWIMTSAVFDVALPLFNYACMSDLLLRPFPRPTWKPLYKKLVVNYYYFWVNLFLLLTAIVDSLFNYNNLCRTGQIYITCAAVYCSNRSKCYSLTFQSVEL